MKVILYGTCSYPFFFREMILRARETGVPIQWKVIALSWRHLALFKGVAADEDVFYVPARVNALMREPMPDTSALLKDYAGSLSADISADKGMPGQLRRMPKDAQLKNALAHYRAYKDYLLREKPDAIFFPTVETHDGMILLALARELGIEPVYRSGARNLNVAYFSRTPNEELPRYVMSDPPPAPLAEKARRLVDDFARNPLPAFQLQEPRPEDVIAFRKREPVSRRLHRLPVFLWNLWKDGRLEPHAGRANPFWYQPIVYLWGFYLKLMRVKGWWQRRYFDLFKGDPLPERFLYCPLHVWPELSVTSMEPYFEDPLRVIDLIRLRMPSDHVLVVKEHPGMRGRRATSFYKALRSRSAVVLAHDEVPSAELIRRASMTVTVTGTAAFEALMSGRPSLALGEVFFSPWVCRVESWAGFRESLARALREPPETIRARAADCVARALDAGRDFCLWDPHDYSVDPKYTMNRKNVDSVLAAFQEHMDRARAWDARHASPKEG